MVTTDDTLVIISTHFLVLRTNTLLAPLPVTGVSVVELEASDALSCSAFFFCFVNSVTSD
jgi:hypothetical protein